MGSCWQIYLDLLTVLDTGLSIDNNTIRVRLRTFLQDGVEHFI